MIDIDALVGCISLDREHQMRAVRAALEAMLVGGRKGVVLADEVGCGKTFEALGTLALLWRHFEATDKPIQRVLIIAEPALITKWFSEIEAPVEGGGPKKSRGFPQYVVGDPWAGFNRLLRNVARLRTPRDGEGRGVREEGRIQVQPNRIYLAKPALLTGEREGDASPTVRWLRRTQWDVVIADEAHHYARLHTKKSQVFFPSQTAGSRADGLYSRFTLALTATPFQLSTSELVNLLRVVDAEEADLELLERALPRYERALESFYRQRRFPPEHEARRRVVSKLEKLRTDDALGGEGEAKLGLEELLRKYIIRNVKDGSLRDYALAERANGSVRPRAFEKLTDLKQVVAESPLIPLEGDDAYLYLQLRDLIDDAADAARKDEGETKTFVSGDLRQGLSSYAQLRESALLQKNLPRARAVGRAVASLVDSGARHPKVAALCDVVDRILEAEITALRQNPARSFHKILVFNTLLKTANELKTALEATVAARVEPFVDEALALAGWERTAAQNALTVALNEEREHARGELDRFRDARFSRIDRELVKGTLVEMAAETKHIVDVMFDRAISHSRQPLFLLRFARWMRGVEAEADLEAARQFLSLRVTHRLTESMKRIVDDYLDDLPADPNASPEENRERARRELSRVATILGAPEYVARFDGATKETDKENRRENFNRPYAPLVLLVSRVGEEGIDLQQHTRYVLHYDVEWNPAKMEQREGRVDREGRRSGGAVQVQFFLLKDTYEERIFHTVMERDAWFQILIGSKRQELAKGFGADDADDAPAHIELADDGGRVTAEEMRRVMIDLRPR